MTWKPVPEYPNYVINRDGRIERIPYEKAYTTAGGVTRTMRFASQPIVTRVDHNGYLSAQLTRDGRTRSVPIHKLLLWAFGEPPPSPGMLARHKNDVKLDNRIENLEWGTYRQNWEDAQRNGITVIGVHKAICSRGHDRVPENLTKHGECRLCERIRGREKYARRKNQGKLVTG